MLAALQGKLLDAYAQLGLLGFIGIPLLVVGTWTLAGRKQSQRERRPVTTLPFLENTLDVVRNLHRFYDWMVDQCEYFDDKPWVFEVFGQPRTLVVSTPQAMEDIMKTHFHKFNKNEQAEILGDLIGEGIFAVDGAKWVHQRKTTSKLFSNRLLRDYMTATVKKHIVPLHKILLGARDEKKPVDLAELFSAFTMQAFAEIGFGIDMDCLDPDKEHPFVVAFNDITRLVMTRFFRPKWFCKLQRWLNVGAERGIRECKQVIDQVAMDVMMRSIESHRSEGRQESKNLVSLFLDNTEEKPDPVFLKDIVLTFLFAGRDTTAQTMFWFFAMLDKHPEVERKIREEIQKKLPALYNSTEVGAAPTMEDVQELTYLDAVLKETLRLNPVVAINNRAASEDLVLSDGTFVRKGMNVVFTTYGIGRSKNVWGPDADQFKPERWIDPTTGTLIQVSPFQFPVFHGGPRLCLGINLAMLEMKMVTASLLSKLHISILPNQRVLYDIAVTLNVQGSVLMSVENAPDSANALPPFA